LKQKNIALRAGALSGLRFSKSSLLRLAGLLLFPVVFAVLIYAVDIFLIQMTLKLSLPRGDLLFIEGLVLVVFGSFVLVAGENRASSAGLRQRLLTGVPAIRLRTVFPRDIVRIAFLIIVTGSILILLSLLGA